MPTSVAPSRVPTSTLMMPLPESWRSGRSGNTPSVLRT